MKKFFVTLMFLGLLPYFIVAQTITVNKFEFTPIKEIKSTSVKNQQKTGTCWSFAAVSFLESELLRKGKGEYDLSEMYFAKKAYSAKAQRYVRLQGKGNFSQGGQGHDVLNVIRQYGIVPEKDYTGLIKGSDYHDHTDVENITKQYLESVLATEIGLINCNWIYPFESITDSWLGSVPEKFNYNGTEYTPESFAKSLDINVDDYVELTSFSHHPYYSKFVIEIPDNWSADLVYNLPINEFLEVMNNAITNGYSICWDADVSENTFDYRKGIAVVQEKKWENLTEPEQYKILTEPSTEPEITQELRQQHFDNQLTTDDHLMHIIGKVKDQNNKEYFIVKNSWGAETNNFGGLLYVSEAYAKLKTVVILVHKDAIPKSIAKKLNIN